MSRHQATDNAPPPSLWTPDRQERIRRIEAENYDLSARLGSFRSDNPYINAAYDASRYRRLHQRYTDLQAQYLALEERHGRCKPYIDDATAKYRAAKETVRQWKIYIDRQTTRSRRGGRDEQDITSLAHVTTSVEIPNAAPILNERGHKQRNVEVAELPSSSVTRASSTATTSPRLQATSVTTGRITSSQTTVLETEPARQSPSVKREISSDSEPTVVFSRPVKRRRGNNEELQSRMTSVKFESNSSTAAVELVSEMYSSPPAKHHQLARNQTSDLDALREMLETPQKHRRRRTDRASSAFPSRPPPLPMEASSRSDGVIETDAKLQLGASTTRATSNNVKSVPKQRVQSTNALSPTEVSVLRPRSVNVPSPHPLHPRLVKESRSQEEVARKVALLSEDGDNGSQQSNVTASARDSGLTPKAQVNQRLDSMLDEPTPQNPILFRKTTPGLSNMHPKKPLTPLPKSPPPTKRVNKDQRASGTAETSYQRVNRHAARSPRFKQTAAVPRMRPLGIEDSPPPVRPEDEPLRFRAIGTLRLEDFRINPKYLGADFAFADTLRGRDQRRCLQGCTKPDCCGSAFRKAVELGGAFASDTKTNAEVLEAYLGPHWEELMGAYAPAKRRDLLIQARADAFANQYGKHRQAFARHSTPPGFWRTDMPTTQEEAEDRARAEEMERAKVEERWREAMREGGRWLFRDE